MPALGGVVELDVQVRDAPDAQPLRRARAGRTASPGRARATVASRSAGWPMTLTQTLAWRRSGVVSTSVIVANPIRGSATSRRHDRADLLAQELIDAVRPLVIGSTELAGGQLATRG